MLPLDSTLPRKPDARYAWADLVAAFRNGLHSPFFIRLRSWEYWPFAVVYVPVFVYWLWLSLKARSLFFFSAGNPSIESGGLLGESKIDILDKISDEFKPKTLYIPRSMHIDEAFSRAINTKITFPIIAKPNAGERGWRVEKIEHWEGLVNYIQSSPVDFLVQEYVDYPLELGVFYYRMPGETRGKISSIVQKKFLSITGNGRDCIDTLIRQNDRALLQIDALTAKYGDELDRIPAPGETVVLMPIGNHSRGTTFLNANHLITPELERLFDRISGSIGGFYFGRYDLRCRSVADLYGGRHIRILELNGAGAEPAHIYQPGFSLWAAWGVLLHHWRVLYDISRENHRRGVAYMTLAEARMIYTRIRSDKNQPN
ncbi:MAG: hypothetical protein H7Z72_00490 [Bacteroidetes bacterium]|nr:hypothetical protein [Fibrella sp.]